MTRFSTPLNRWGLGLLLVSLLVSLLPVSGAGAQEAGEPIERDGDDASGFHVTGEKFGAAHGDPDRQPVQHAFGGVDFVWPEGRRYYQWLNQAGYDQSAGPALIAAYDLDTGEEVARTDPEEAPDLDVPYSATPRNTVFFPLADAGDDGRVYAVRTGGGPDSGSSAAGTDLPGTSVCETHTGLGNTTEHPLDSNSRPGYALFGKSCFGGLYVFDGRTMELVDQFDFAPLSLDGESSVYPTAVDVTWTPPYDDEGAPKVHVLINERVHDQGGMLFNQQALSPRTRRNDYWVAQFDALTGEMDWVVRVDVCAGENSDYGSGWTAPHGTVFRNRDAERPTVWVACTGAGRDVAGVAALDLDPEVPDGAPTGQRTFLGPGNFTGTVADPVSERIMIGSQTSPSDATWWVFDGKQDTFLGQVGLGAYNFGPYDTVGLDETAGRFYVFASPKFEDTSREKVIQTAEGGLAYTDLRSEDVGQFAWDRDLVELARKPSGDGYYSNSFNLLIDPAADGRPTRVLFRPGRPDKLEDHSQEGPHYHVIEDHTPRPIPTEDALDRNRTVDVPEVPGATSASFIGDARGYGFRHIQVGGLDAVHNSPADHNGLESGVLSQFPVYNYENQCRTTDREIALGLAGSPIRNERSRIDDLGSATGQAIALYADPQTRRDLNRPLTRCGGESTGPVRPLSGVEIVLEPPTWEELGELVNARGFDDEDEPGVQHVYRTLGHDSGPYERVTCAAPDRQEDAHQGPVLSGMTAEVACRDGQINGSSRGRLLQAGPVTVGDAGTQYRVQRHGAGGIESSIKAWTRDITVVSEQGAVFIDAVTAEAVAWATGRQQPEEADTSCDRNRTAGTCYTRSISGVRVLGPDGQTFSCDQCNSEESQRQMVQAMDRALGGSWAVTRRQPDEALARGSQDGYEAGIIKPAITLEADAGLKGDLLPTLPALEIVRLNDGANGRGRQTYLFAGIETALTYGINCLKTVTDGECSGNPSSLTISLNDVDGDPLQGGLFQVQPDADGDGEISVEESLAQPLACTTGPDGTCGFETIPPGSYVVHQAAAPPGYLPAPDKAIDLPEGGQGRLDIVNGTPSVTGVAISLHDTSSPPQPLEGAEFEVHAGSAPVDAPLAGCTTNANGVCEFEVAAVGGIEPITGLVDQDLTHVLQLPAGPYVIHQSSAPDGYEPADDVAFDLPDGQIARVDLTNGVVAAGDGIETAPSASGGGTAGDLAAEPSPEPVSFQQPAEVPAPQFTINVNVQQEAPVPAPQVAGDEGNTFNVFANPMQSAKLLLRDPKEAAAFAAAWLLFASAAAAAWRRRMILAQFDV